MEEKEGNVPQQSHSNSNICSCLGSLVFSTFLVLVLLLSLCFFFLSFPLSESSSWPVLLLTVPIFLVSTLFLLRKRKGSDSEEDESLVVQEMKMQKEELQLRLQTEEIGLIQIHEQQAESQSDSSFPSDSESTNGSAMDEKLELNPKNTSSSLPSDADETESFELDQNSTRVLGIYERLASDNEDEEDDDDEEEEDDDDDDDDLIEINLPSSNFSGSGKEVGQRLESTLPDFLPQAMFKQEGLMELLAEINEMNEDENLIEIDISNDLRLNQELPFSGDRYSVVTDS